MNKELKRAVQAAQLSALAWGKNFDSPASYPPYIPAGIKSLRRSGRADLIPALRKKLDNDKYYTPNVLTFDYLKSII
jgi:hypothetical protein